MRDARKEHRQNYLSFKSRIERAELTTESVEKLHESLLRLGSMGLLTPDEENKLFNQIESHRELVEFIS